MKSSINKIGFYFLVLVIFFLNKNVDAQSVPNLKDNNAVTNAFGNDPNTSPNPPVFEKGLASPPTNNTFKIIISFITITIILHIYSMIKDNSIEM